MKTFNIEKLQHALEQVHEINFALLFGSAKNGFINRQGTDIDIAVHLAVAPTPDLLVLIIGICQDAIKFENIDISILNTYNPILGFEALSGKLLMCRDRDLYAEYFSLTCRYYEDEMMRIAHHSKQVS